MVESNVYLYHEILHRYLQDLKSYSRCDFLKELNSKTYNPNFSFKKYNHCMISIGVSMILLALDKKKDSKLPTLIMSGRWLGG